MSLTDLQSDSFFATSKSQVVNSDAFRDSSRLGIGNKVVCVTFTEVLYWSLTVCVSQKPCRESLVVDNKILRFVLHHCCRVFVKKLNL